MPNKFRHVAHRQMLDAALDAAATEVIARGWNGLRMRAIAEEIGVSRQTLYTAFTDKQGMARALVAREADRFLTGVERAIAGEGELRAQWAAAVCYTLQTAASDPLVKEVLTADSSEELLPLVTSGSAPIISAAKVRLCAAFLAVHPGLDPRELEVVAETVTRLALSHMVQPTDPAEIVAGQVGELAARFLEYRR